MCDFTMTTRAGKAIIIIDKGIVDGELREYHFHPMLSWKKYGMRMFLILGCRRGSKLMMKDERISGVIGHPNDMKDLFPKAFSPAPDSLKDGEG